MNKFARTSTWKTAGFPGNPSCPSGRPVHPPVVGSFDFNLSPKGELLRLFEPFGTLVDYVEYGDKAPWPTKADGMVRVGKLLQNELEEEGDPGTPAGVGGWSTGHNEEGPRIGPALAGQHCCWLVERHRPSTTTTVINNNQLVICDFVDMHQWLPPLPCSKACRASSPSN
eukprot:8313654-Pyramimonas_sp.AAC.1